MGNNPNAWGIYVDSNDNYPIIEKNKIEVLSESGVGVVLWDTSNATVNKNKIRGNGLTAVALLTPGWLSTDNNAMIKNNVNNFDALLADYYLAADVFNNNLYLKQHDTVLDDSGNDTNIVIRGRCAGCSSSSLAEVSTANGVQAAQQVIGWETKRAESFRMLYRDLAK